MTGRPASPLLVDVPERVDGVRVGLRPYADADAVALLEAVEEGRESLARWFRWPGRVRSLDGAREYVRRSEAQWLLRERLMWAIRRLGRDDSGAPHDDERGWAASRGEPGPRPAAPARGGGGRLLGGVALINPDWEARVFELAYWLRPSAQGTGYMREAVGLVMGVAFGALEANRLVIRAEPGNARSRRVAESLGFVHEGTLRADHIGPEGELVDVAVYSMLRGEFGRRDGTQRVDMPGAGRR